MQSTISKPAQIEVLESLRQRYQQARKQNKTKILDEFIAVAGCHRKHAIRLLADFRTVASEVPAVDRRTYDEAVREALVVLWEAADRICGKRLKEILPQLVTAMERHGHLALDPTVRHRLLAVSPATIDRLLATVRGQASHRKKRRTPNKPSKQIPIRTFADWNEPLPGFLEVDFVSHGSSSMKGSFLWSLVATDVCSGWTEAVALVAREQTLVTEGLNVIRRQSPIPILGIDTDNDSAFINETLLAYCQEQKLEFTRSRAYQKNDQAWIEQKNGAVIRRFVGYERFAGMAAGQCLAQLLQGMRLFVNHFQPSFKLKSKKREGAKVKKLYHKPATPCERLLQHASVAEAAKERLRTERDQLDPLEPLRRIRESQSALAALGSGDHRCEHVWDSKLGGCQRVMASAMSFCSHFSCRKRSGRERESTKTLEILAPETCSHRWSGDLGSGPERESLEQFLAKLPELWRKGEARPTHRREASGPRYWRTRKDPFDGVWPEILLWLQGNPEATAKSLLDRLHRERPGQFPEGQLRTLQRRIREWRRVMARELVYACMDGKEASERPLVIGAGGKG